MASSSFQNVVSFCIFHGFILLFSFCFCSQFGVIHGGKEEFSIIDWDLGDQDYSPLSPPPSPPPIPNPPSLSCEEDLKGNGSLNTSCHLHNDLELKGIVYIEGTGNLDIFPGVNVSCLGLGCSIMIDISGDFSLGQNSSIFTSTLSLNASNASFLDGSIINTTALAGKPPPQTSGVPHGLDGAGGGHGGRGACCLIDKTKLPEDSWGGDTYAWSKLEKPWSYGSKGGTTSKEKDYGGGGGGRVKMEIKGCIVINGTILADGGDGGLEGGGGSGGSVHIKAHKM